MRKPLEENYCCKMVLFIGRTCAGKDTFLKKLQSEGILNPVVSYTTRPIRESETPHIEHHFITKEQAEDILSCEGYVAYTKFIPKNATSYDEGYEYFVTPNEFYSKNAYIINPSALNELFTNAMHIKFMIVYIDASFNTRLKRSIKRGDISQQFHLRCNAEDKEFDDFLKYRNKYHIDVYVNNDSKIFFWFNYLRLKYKIKKFLKK